MNPKLPGDRRRDRETAQNRGTWIALVMVFAITIGFIALAAQVMPQIAGLFIVVAGLFSFICLHYFTWGRWLTARLAKLETEEESQE